MKNIKTTKKTRKNKYIRTHKENKNNHKQTINMKSYEKKPIQHKIKLKTYEASFKI